ncbi:MAG TPA: YraN family protein [Aliidongia sp.]|uniref:YraN family protein n=1 Tax=Aliidongia sp. TaxID=1914230 RepID=UPI002DDD0B44|nr:YraN family protein [Aliidongia sp.]HEV2673701.1 YraN family protein [Aliidongia sp.]
MTRQHRVVAEKHGHRSETIAAWWLRLKGYRIVARRYRTAAGEIDLIVRRGRVLVFVEVKARADFRSAADAVSPRQRHRIARAAAQFLAARPDLAALDQRFDALLIVRRTWPRHLPDAWRADG